MKKKAPIAFNSVYKTFSKMPAQESLRSVEAVEQGLSQAEHKKRLEKYGPNSVASDRVTSLMIFIRQFKSPYVYLMAVASLVAFLTGQMTDGGMIMFFIFVNSAIGYYQEHKAEKASSALKHYWRIYARVMRDGKVDSVSIEQLVPGDVILLRAGDRIPADVRFISTEALSIDESILTGESIAVEKRAEAMSREPADYYQANNIGFGGTNILTGEAKAVVIATGRQSVFGQIATLTSDTKAVTAFEKQINSFSSFTLRLVAVTLAFVFVLNIGMHGLGQLEELLLFCIALTIGVIPEALPLVMTFTLSSAALRMAKKNVIVKRLSAINDLGSVDVLCTDKTGTITENRMEVADIQSDDKDKCLLYALSACDFRGGKRAESTFDPALWESADRELKAQIKKSKMIDEVPFDPVRRFSSALVEIGHSRYLILRGSPEDVLANCLHNTDIGKNKRYIKEQGYSGRRILAIASVKVDKDYSLSDKLPSGIRLSGLVSFVDPLKPGTAKAIETGRELGIQIKIITGDAKEVAGAVATELGLIDNQEQVITGEEFSQLPPEQQLKTVEIYNVFARVNPEQKHSIISLLESSGHTVGYLGEGFNDAPALKAANVSIAVSNAADVAKDAADVILLKKTLSTIIDGVAEGRRSFGNTIKYLHITLSANFGNFYAVAIASLLIPFLPMLPAQILLVNLLTDTPMIMIASDTVATADLRRPNRYSARGLLLVATLIGIVSSVFDFVTFAIFRPLGESGLQTLWFIESVLTEIALIYSMRTRLPLWRGSRVPLIMCVLSLSVVGFTLLLPYTAFGQDVFGFMEPNIKQLLIVALIVTLYMVATEVAKIWLERFEHNGKSAKN